MKKLIILSFSISILYSCRLTDEEATNPVIGSQNLLQTELHDLCIENYLSVETKICELEEINRRSINQRQKEKVSEALKAIRKIDQLLIEWIDLIEKKRINLIHSNNEDQILIVETDKVFQKFRPLNLNLLNDPGKIVNVKLKENFDYEFIFLRGEVLRTLVQSASYPLGGKFSFADPEVMGTETDETVIAKINQIWINSIMSIDDQEFVPYWYRSMLLEENFEKKYLTKSSLVNVLNTLNALELKLVTARKTIISHISSRVSVGEFGFNTIEPIVNVVNNVKKGGTIELEVYPTVYDNTNTLQAEAENQISAKVVNGKTKITIQAGYENIMHLKGTASVKGKSGTKYTCHWKKMVYLK